MTGQTSQVLEVIHDARRQRYALKMLLEDFRRQREHIGYMKHEYAVGKELDHPGVIHIHELGTHEGGPYMVMELFAAPNLKQYIQRGVERIAHLAEGIIDQAADALGYFHRQGWIHRDIKPDNYLMSPAGEVKLIDFALAEKKKTGLARLLAGKSKIQGTRSYMSPEQIRGQSLDQRADIYSFGCLVHQLLCGKPPFAGVSSTDLLNKHLRTPPPPLEAVNANVTPEMAELVRRTLSKDRDKRPESMEQFRREFRTLRVFKQRPRAPAEESAG